jgi:hypothetical protein
MRDESILYDYCRRDSFKSAGEFLNSLEREHKSIDIMYNNGLFFRLVLSSKSVDSQKIKFLTSLLKYFEKTKPQEEYARLIMQHKLGDILEEALKSYKVSDEMNEILKPYLWEDDSDYEQGLEDIIDDTGGGYGFYVGVGVGDRLQYSGNLNVHHETNVLGQNASEIHHVPAH